MKIKITEDAISRQAVEEMIKAELPERGIWEIEGDKVKNTVCEVCADLLQELSELPPVEPKTVADAISKHDLWRIIEDNAYWVTYNETSKEKGMTLTGINQALNECPPVQPERPQGEWIQNAPEGQGIDPPYICSICGYAEATRTPFCEQCGADMRGDKE